MPVPTVSTPMLWTCAMWIIQTFQFNRRYLVQVFLLAVDKKEHSHKTDVLDQGVFCTRMESCLYCLHPLLLLDWFEEYKSLLAEVKLLEADGIKVRWTLVSSQPTGKAACKWTIPTSNAHLSFNRASSYGCNTTHHQDFVHSHSRCQQRMRSLEHLWTGPLSLPSDEKGQFNSQSWITGHSRRRTWYMTTLSLSLPTMGWAVPVAISILEGVNWNSLGVSLISPISILEC